MSTFYFDLLVGHHTGNDEVGVPAADIEGALREAIQRGRLALAVADENGQDWRDAMLIVRTGDRSIVCAFRLSTLLRSGPLFAAPIQ